MYAKTIMTQSRRPGSSASSTYNLKVTRFHIRLRSLLLVPLKRDSSTNEFHSAE